LLLAECSRALQIHGARHWHTLLLADRAAELRVSIERVQAWEGGTSPIPRQAAHD
jgi:DNA-binding transcriptional regulator YiaG